jgi:DNA primase
MRGLEAVSLFFVPLSTPNPSKDKNLSESKVPVALQRILKQKPEINTVYLHLDSDKAGREGAKGMIAVLGDKYTIKYVPPRAGKDFNDFLLAEIHRENERKQNENNSLLTRYLQNRIKWHNRYRSRACLL